MSAIEDGESPELTSVSTEEVLATIAEFTQIGEGLRELVQSAAQLPSAEHITRVNTTCAQVSSSTEPFSDTQFFRDSSNGMLVDAAVGAVMNETEAFWRAATELRPDNPTKTNFGDGFREKAVAALMSTEADCSDDDDERSPEDRVKHATGLLCDTYSAAVDNLLDKFMGSERVIDLHIAELEQEHKKERLQTAGIVIVAAFAGTLAANWFDRKMGRKI